MKSFSLIIGEGSALAWGIDSAIVRAVLPMGSGHGQVPSLLPSLFVGVGEQRVLIIETGSGPIVRRVAGSLVLRRVDEGQLLPLPAEVLGPASTFSSVIFDGDAAPILVLDAARLGGMDLDRCFS